MVKYVQCVQEVKPFSLVLNRAFYVWKGASNKPSCVASFYRDQETKRAHTINLWGHMIITVIKKNISVFVSLFFLAKYWIISPHGEKIRSVFS